jgi:hypothetical protein
MFGYPTGLGAVLARREALRKLHRPWFAGGTISWASVLGEAHTLSEGSEGFEDGTLNYTSLPAVEMALGLTRGEIVGCLADSGDRMTLGQFRQCVDGKSTGAVRISFGVASDFRDAWIVLSFFRTFAEG